jgi:hypothetical protein
MYHMVSHISEEIQGIYELMAELFVLALSHISEEIQRICELVAELFV